MRDKCSVYVSEKFKAAFRATSKRGGRYQVLRSEGLSDLEIDTDRA